METSRTYQTFSVEAIFSADQGETAPSMENRSRPNLSLGACLPPVTSAKEHENETWYHTAQMCRNSTSPVARPHLSIPPQVNRIMQTLVLFSQFYWPIPLAVLCVIALRKQIKDPLEFFTYAVLIMFGVSKLIAIEFIPFLVGLMGPSEDMRTTLQLAMRMQMVGQIIAAPVASTSSQDGSTVDERKAGIHRHSAATSKVPTTSRLGYPILNKPYEGTQKEGAPSFVANKTR